MVFCIVLLYWYIWFLLFSCIIFFVPYKYVSNESVDWIILLPLALKEILLTFSVNTLCLSLLNQCYNLNINLQFFINSLWFFHKLSVSSLFFHRKFISFSIWFVYRQFLNSSNSIFCFTAYFFVPFVFYFHHYHLLYIAICFWS